MKIQLESGSPSSATHKLTRPSTTLNRRYVSRPTNLAIEEVARTAERPRDRHSSTPSRLVNLRVHDTDLAALQTTEYPTPPSAAATPPECTPPQDTFSTYEESIIDYASYQPDTDSHDIYDQSIAQMLDTPSQLPAQIEPALAALPAEVDTRALAMSIAADYTAATIGATISNTSSTENTDALSIAIREQHATQSIDEIARTASEAIASIQAATDPAEISRQIRNLKQFAADIKSNNDLPEIIELGDTIEKFITIAMKSTGIQAEPVESTVQSPKSVTLSAKANRAANKVTKSTSKIISAAPTPQRTQPARAASRKPTPSNSRSTRTTKPINRTATRSPHTNRATSRSLDIDKDVALRKALQSVAVMDEDFKDNARTTRRHTGNVKRFLLAFGCASACVAGILYFVGTNIPDISVRVAAMQNGIEASYPSYIPRGFSLNDINSENGKIALTFNHPENGSFTLTEEKSSWDSTALLRNYVEPTWQSSYTTTHEQGITIYIYGSNATWVNGGVLYKIDADNNTLSKKQLRNIVTSI